MSVGGVRYLDKYFRGESVVATDDTGHAAATSPLWGRMYDTPDRYLAAATATHTLNTGQKLRLFFGRPLGAPANFNYQYLYDDVRQIASELESREITTVIDSSKTVRSLAEIVSTVADEVYVLHLTRDVRGVANSNRRQGMRVLTAARYWLSDLVYGRVFLWWHVPRSHRMTVRYEAFVQEPEHWLTRINNVCGIAVDTTDFFSQLDRFPSYRFAGNQMRLRPITQLSLDEAWRRELPLWYRWMLAPLNLLRP